VKEAEEHAEEDRKKREAIELRNNADNALWATERTLKELGDKVTPEEKSQAEKAMDELRAAMEKDDLEEIKSKMRAMDEVMHRISNGSISRPRPKGPKAVLPGQDQSKQDDDVVDADYTEET